MLKFSAILFILDVCFCVFIMPFSTETKAIVSVIVLGVQVIISAIFYVCNEICNEVRKAKF